MGVSNHSTYDQAPFTRLWDTLCLATALTMGSDEDRATATAYIASRHSTINGAVEEVAYNAESKSAQMFVWGCLVENVEAAYHILGLEPDPGFLEDVYQDWIGWAEQFGIPRAIIPNNRLEFHEYVPPPLTRTQSRLIHRPGFCLLPVLPARLAPSLPAFRGAL